MLWSLYMKICCLLLQGSYARVIKCDSTDWDAPSLELAVVEFLNDALGLF